jgi:hypothetical protein
MPNGGDTEKEFWIGLTVFGGVFATGLYAIVEEEWWLGGFFTAGGGFALLAMTPLIRSRIQNILTSHILLWVATITVWLFLAATISVYVYNRVVHGSTIAALQSALVSSKHHLLTALADLSNDAAQLLTLKSQLAQSANQIGSLQQQLTATTANLHQANEQISSLQDELSRAKRTPHKMAEATPIGTAILKHEGYQLSLVSQQGIKNIQMGTNPFLLNTATSMDGLFNVHFGFEKEEGPYNIRVSYVGEKEDTTVKYTVGDDTRAYVEVNLAFPDKNAAQPRTVLINICKR